MEKKIIYNGAEFCTGVAFCPVVELYDGTKFCIGVLACPKVEHDTEQKMVKIYDPHKPENGSFVMTAEEYNLLLKNAKPVVL